MSTSIGFGADQGVCPTSPRLPAVGSSTSVNSWPAASPTARAICRTVGGSGSPQLKTPVRGCAATSRTSSPMILDALVWNRPSQLFGMRGFVGDHIDDEVETVRDGKCALVIAVESCKLEFFRLAVARSYRHLPAVGRESPGDGSADVAGSTDDEGALCDRGLRGD